MTDGPRITNPLLFVRCGLGGVLMGLANLVPGISGGTMLLATGVYRRFVDAVARATTFRWSLDVIVTLLVIVAGAGFAIVLGAGIIRDLVHEHRWVMYSLFLGLTLGGVPLRRAGPVRRLTCPSSPWAVQARWPRPPSARARNGPPAAKRRG
ncbi:MAG: DUF368 domain-containing protein, partial [Phycisphaerales bacterium]|nr:DUF368 domain-containing protein [Phycisphaerales bacterium]